MKYRRLTTDELTELEKEFIRFLASNHITAHDWEKLKEKDPKRVESLIEVFSDIVFEKILQGIEYLEFKTPTDIKTFHCEKEKITMMGMMVEGKSALDFTKNLAPDQMIQLLKLSNADLKLYKAEKKYKGNREEELFKMLENGCLISKDGALYKTLYSLKS